MLHPDPSKKTGFRFEPDMQPPAPMRECLRQWIEEAEPHPAEMGNFLFALLVNDLRLGGVHADADNSKLWKSWALLLSNDVPPPAWGSVEKILAWYDRVHPAAPP